MATSVTLPPLNLSPIFPNLQSWQYVEGQTPVDLTASLDGVDYTGTLLLAVCDEVKHRLPLTLDDTGGMTATISAEIAEELRSCHRVDATYQITLSSPIPEQSFVGRGVISVWDELK